MAWHRRGLLQVLCAFVLIAGTLIGALAPAGRGAAQGEDATELLHQSAAAMSNLQSFHFELTTTQGKSLILDNLELGGVEGDVVRPDKFQATITAKVAIIEVNVDVIVVGGRIWVTDPLSQGKQYMEVTGGEGMDPADTQGLVDLINPDRLLLTAVGFIENATIDGTEELDGEDVTRVVGEIDTSRLAAFAGGTPTAGIEGGPELVIGKMPVTIWIDGENRVVSMELEGPLTTAESGDVVRRLDLYDFDKPVEIEAPSE